MLALLSLPLAYVIGAIPFGFLLVRWKTGKDVRALGSGNIGATNVMRTSGRELGIVTLLLDGLKGWLAVWLAAWLSGHDASWMSAAALAAVAGHAYPIFLGFQGGKAVATFTGAFLHLAPLPCLATFVVFLVVVAASRYVSLGSIVAAATFPLAVYLIQHPPFPVLAAAIAGGAFIIWRHRTNIARLREGTENFIRFRGLRS